MFRRNCSERVDQPSLASIPEPWQRAGMRELHVIDHPLVQHKLTIMRKKETSTAGFRRLLTEVSHLLAYEVTREMPTALERIETPMGEMDAPLLDGKKICLVAVLRAGLGLLDGILQLIPAARVGHVGMYRDEATLEPVEYYFKVPDQMEERECIIVDPMLATGHSAAAAIEKVKSVRPRSIKFLCLLAAPEGIEYLHKHHPDVPIYTAAVDEKLNDVGFIVPGLGDAGDRMFGTR